MLNGTDGVEVRVDVCVGVSENLPAWPTGDVRLLAVDTEQEMLDFVGVGLVDVEVVGLVDELGVAEQDAMVERLVLAVQDVVEVRVVVEEVIVGNSEKLPA